MYTPHQDAQLIPLTTNSTYRQVGDNRLLPNISATASTKDGKVTVSLTNTDLKNPCEVEIPLNKIKASKVLNADILTSKDARDYNDFDNPNKVTIKKFDGAKISKGMLKVTLPAMSIATITLN